MGSPELHIRGQCHPHGLARSGSAAHDKGGYAVSQLRPRCVVSEAVWSAHLKLRARQRAQPRWFVSVTRSPLPTWMATHTMCGYYPSDHSNHPGAARGHDVSVSNLHMVFGGPERGGWLLLLLGRTEIFQVVSSPLPAPVPIQRSVILLQISCHLWLCCLILGCQRQLPLRCE